MRRFVLLFCMNILVSTVMSQSLGRLYGKVTDTSGLPLDMVNVIVKERQQIGTITNEIGRYGLDIPTNEDFTIVFSLMGYEIKEEKVRLASGKRQLLNIQLSRVSCILPKFTVSEKYSPNMGIERVDSKLITKIPGTGSGVEGLIKSAGLGVHSNNELSSQYNVRGGNYDENLIYVNGIEIFRPFLIRSGQQEGLSFINSDLVSSVKFSSGGFDSKYGDKMSSVLDVSYKEPKEKEGSISCSLLGASAHLGGSSENGKFSYLLGARYQSNAYLLKSMQVQGDYQPDFTDIQAMLRYKPSDRWKISLFGNYAMNEYRLEPKSGEVTLGSILTSVKRLNIYYDGREVDAYQTLFTSFNATYISSSEYTEIQLTGSYFRSMERETFDINAEYFLSDIDMNFGDESLGKSISSRAVGGELHHGRNYLCADILHTEIKGRHIFASHVLTWGLSYQKELIQDKLYEWYLYDSSFYSLPHPYIKPGDSVFFSDPSRLFETSNYLNVSNNVGNHRFQTYIQDQYEFGQNKYRYILTTGLRASCSFFTKEAFVTPKARFMIQPIKNKRKSAYLATGWYFQPPLYKEMRNRFGVLNEGIRSQKSFHIILGADYIFSWGNHPFKLTGELYYKYLWDLISYDIDNVRIIYSARNDADGFAVGADAKISGELLPGLESWLSISLLKTMEDIRGDFYVKYTDSLGNTLKSSEGAVNCDTVYPGWIPRPTDQRFTVNLFFQDQMPKVPTVKVHINLIYSTPLPYGIVGTPKYTHTYRSKAYFRTDVGFSWRFLLPSSNTKSPLSCLKSGTLTAEILNMFNYYNIISYTAVNDIDGNTYLTANYLTPRLYNLKLRFDF